MLRKVISGGQTGSDIGGVMAAKMFGIETGGWMPNGWKTSAGSRPEYRTQYGMTEHVGDYKERTRANVEDSDATVRFACYWSSAGERCTKRAILDYDKPYWDVDVINLASYDWDAPDAVMSCCHPKHFIRWLEEKKVETLNVAGNRQGDFYSKTGERHTIQDFVVVYLSYVFRQLGFEKGV